MLSSLEEAMPFFGQWKNERTPLDVVFSDQGVGLRFSGFLVKASREDGLVVTNGESPEAVLTVSLRWVRSLSFADALEASRENRPLVESSIQCAWEITLLKGAKLALYARRE
jgi:hypothetical protein